MSFKKKIYKLKWEEGHAYHGLEIRVKGLSFADLTQLQGLAGIKDSEVTDEVIDPVLELFADKIVSWNYVDEDDNPVPVSLEEVKGLDIGAILSALQQWQEVVVGVNAPLKQGSSFGETSQEASIPMESL